jgi:hypothetical protein
VGDEIKAFLTLPNFPCTTDWTSSTTSNMTPPSRALSLWKTEEMGVMRDLRMDWTQREEINEVCLFSTLSYKDKDMTQTLKSVWDLRERFCSHTTHFFNLQLLTCCPPVIWSVS